RAARSLGARVRDAARARAVEVRFAKGRVASGRAGAFVTACAVAFAGGGAWGPCPAGTARAILAVATGASLVARARRTEFRALAGALRAGIRDAIRIKGAASADCTQFASVNRAPGTMAICIDHAWIARVAHRAQLFDAALRDAHRVVTTARARQREATGVVDRAALCVAVHAEGARLAEGALGAGSVRAAPSRAVSVLLTDASRIGDDARSADAAL